MIDDNEPEENEIELTPETPSIPLLDKESKPQPPHRELEIDNEEDMDLKLERQYQNVSGEIVEIRTSRIDIRLTSKLFDCKQLTDFALDIYNYILGEKEKENNGNSFYG